MLAKDHGYVFSSCWSRTERRRPHGPTEVYPPAYSLVEGVPFGVSAASGPGNRNHSPAPPSGPGEAVLGRCSGCGRRRAELCRIAPVLREGDRREDLSQFVLQPLHPGLYPVSARVAERGIGEAEPLRRRCGASAG